MDGVGAKTKTEDTTKETVCMPSASKAKAKAKEIFTSAGRLDATQGDAPTSQSARARARDSKENVTIAAREGIPHGNARNAKKEESQKEKVTVTKGRAKDGVGERASGKSTEKNLKEIRHGNRRRKNQGAPIQLGKRR